MGPRSFQSLTSWKRYQLGRTNGSSCGPPTSCGTVPPTLRGAPCPGRLDGHDLGSARPGSPSSRSRMPRSSSSGNSSSSGERGVEVDVDGVVERVVDALEQREPADVVGRRLRAADLAVLPERAAVDEEVQLVEQRHRVPVGARRVVEERRLPGLDGRVARPAPRRGRAARGRPRASPVRPHVLRVALPPAPAGAELDDRQVPGDREPDGPALARGQRRRSPRPRRPTPDPLADRAPMARAPGSSRPSAAKSAQSSRSATGSNVGRALSSTPSPRQRGDRQRAAQGGRRVVAGVAELARRACLPRADHAVRVAARPDPWPRTDRPR